MAFFIVTAVKISALTCLLLYHRKGFKWGEEEIGDVSEGK
jgi:hypothetical protein